MRLRNLHRFIAVIAVAAAASPLATGCEVISTVDRSAVPPAAECAAATDCNDTPGDCLAPACENGLCQDVPVPSGSACSADDGKLCDDAGACVGCLAATDCAATPNGCTIAMCTDGACSSMNAPKDTECVDDGAFCDGEGACVECNSASQCSDAAGDCKVATCATSKCVDENEAKGKACSANGGKVCNAAGACVECNADGECASKICKADGACAAASCGDAVKNGTESDVDCGGDCDGCADAKKCVTGPDCMNKVCKSGLCQPATCTDNAQNGDETDKDCGGSCPSKCADTLACMIDADCASKVCVGSVCQPPACNDLVKNGAETDVDCGSVCPTKCGSGKGCLTGTDCTSGLCTAKVCI